MNQGVYIGARALERERPILLLGESHPAERDGAEKGEPVSFSTEGVVRDWCLSTDRSGRLRFFENILLAFGFDPKKQNERERFWASVCFGNFVPLFCGTGDDTARRLIREEKNRTAFNDALFSFVNEHGISELYCFSRLVYNSLPVSVGRSMRERERMEGWNCLNTGGRRDWISHWRYLPGMEHRHSSVILERELNVYGLRHPASRCGFAPEHYSPVLNALWAREGDAENC